MDSYKNLFLAMAFYVNFNEFYKINFIFNVFFFYFNNVYSKFRILF